MKMHGEDLRPLLMFLCKRAKELEAGLQLPCRLEAVSLEDNPMDATYAHTIAQSLRKLAEARAGEKKTWNAGLQKSQSLLLEENMQEDIPEVPLRYAMSEADADIEHSQDGGGGVLDARTRNALQKRLEDECTTLLDRIDTYMERRAEAAYRAMEERRQAEEAARREAEEIAGAEAARRRAAATAQAHAVARPRDPVGHHLSDDESSEEHMQGLRQGIKPHSIPDSGVDLGFVPPDGRHHPAYAELNDIDSTPDSTPRAMPPRRGSTAVDGGRRHAKLDLLRGLFQQSGGVPVGPEVLRYALDVISSDTSISAAENDEALVVIWDHIAELRRLHELRQAAAAGVSANASGQLGGRVRSAHSV